MPASKSRKGFAKTPQEACAGTVTEVSIQEAKTHLSRLLAQVEAGGTVTITRRGKAVAKLGWLSKLEPRVPGSMKGQIVFDESFFDPLPDDELELWGEK